MFPLTQEELHSILSTALSSGGEFADIYMEDTKISSLELQDGKVSQAQQAMLYGAGIRVVSGTQTGYAYTMDLSLQAMQAAARFAGCMQGNGHPTLLPSSIWRDKPLANTTSTEPAEEASPEETRRLLLRIDKLARELNPDVIRVKACLAQRLQHIQFVSSEGIAFTDYRPRTTIFLTIVMQRGTEKQMGYCSRMYQQGAEFVTDDLIRTMVEESIQQAMFLFTARQAEGGEMPVVMAAGGSGILLHEAIGHAFEADFIRTGDSIFSGQLGKQICHPSINIVDDATQPGDAGFLRFDDEGTPGQRTFLVHNGTLNSYLHDRISARHFHVNPTGNGRRESFRHTPQPRMRSTYMLAGDATEEDIIRSVRRGIYATHFTNGQVQIGAGDFTFYMKQGYLIEDGRLTTPLRDLNITGNGPQALRDISMVANNLHIDHSATMCGKGGQRVPVSQGIPTVKVDKLVVG